MNKTTIVAFLLLQSSIIFADCVTWSTHQIESEWAQIYYGYNSDLQKKNYPVLLEKVEQQLSECPRFAELTVWKAILIATNAAYETPFKALSSIRLAKNLLEQVIHQQPDVLEGAAFVTLGTLYYMTPGWPISFGNDNYAEKMLQKALEINPHSIDANYFYADYLLTEDRIGEAADYFKLAMSIPSRENQLYADEQLKLEAERALHNTQKRILSSGRNKFLSLISSASNDD